MFNNFPYTNFHNLNLDWIVKTVKLLFNKSVFSINNIEPDDDGNVTITGTELGAVGTVNNIAPVDGNVTITASDVGAIATGQGVTKVNGISPDGNGNVLAGTVRSVNGIYPTSLPTPGNIYITASDVGALPSTIDPVETVNGLSPDANGNVNVGTVKSVNNSTPDANGNVNLPTVAGVTSINGIGADAQGNIALTVVNSRILSTTGLTLETGVSSANYVLTRRPQLGLIAFSLNFTLSESKLTHQAIIRGLPVPTTGGPVWFLVRDVNTGLCYRLNIDYNGTITSENNLSEGTYEGNVTYSYLGEINMAITQG